MCPCLNGTSSKNVPARGAARVLLSQRRTEALVSVLIIVIPSTVILSANRNPSEFRFLSGCSRRSHVDLYSRCSQRVLATTRAEEHIDRTAYVTPSGKFCFEHMRFGVCNAPWLFQHMMSVTLGHLGPESGILTCMDNIIVLILRSKLT